MRVVALVKHGEPKNLKIKEVEKPSPSENEVLIKIIATSVTSGDVALRKQSLLQYILLWPVARLFFGVKNQRKKVLGHEFSGVIEEVGSNVSNFKNGDVIFGTTGFQGGAHAEYICLEQNKTIGYKPKALSFVEAATLPVGGICALYLLQKAEIKNGDKVLIYGASGSIGTYAVQIAKYYNAEVTGVCSAANASLVESLGANSVINYQEVDIGQTVVNYDIIFDTVGKISKSRVKNILKKEGRFISTHSSPVRETREHLTTLLEMVKAGKLRPVIDKVYSFKDIPAAHEYVETGRKRGNVAIEVRRHNGEGILHSNE